MKLEFYMKNIDLKYDPRDVSTRYLLFCNVSGSDKILSKCGHMFHIVSTRFREMYCSH